MPELDALPAATDPNITDDDLLLIFEKGAASDKSRRITIAQLLAGVARAGGDISLDAVVINDLSVSQGTASILAIGTRLMFPSNQGIQNVRVFQEVVAIPVIAADASDTVDVTLTGVRAGDIIQWTAEAALESGLIVQAWVSADDTVSLEVHNAGTGSSTATNYTINFLAITGYTP